ncbi:endonuclease/exonuclease/phosphatase family protein [Streptomyces sp. ISL-43]|uniref:endonuclease/exonuclease/phosphatase family protein n=1 Tax=Streptomyces sp. ISL-43 TaxID=2819183 RepID=UPI001BEBDF25|nr:endonuclease/exonuclease/phosphatase family protein [Streptomyces sp. ISL-43]MBT2447973.1 endonuclease/exonuclease/phosphatase family protein [Streptomyces sp. ISL-43]
MTQTDTGTSPGPPRTPRFRIPRIPPIPTLSLLLATLLAFPSLVPNTVGHPGSLLETFLPWLGLAIPLLLGLAALRRSTLRRSTPPRSTIAALTLLLPTLAWLAQFGGLLLPAATAPTPTPTGGAPTLTTTQHNISDENPDPAGTAHALAASHADLIALEELTPSALPAVSTALAPGYPHHATHGTVGLWSKYPLTDIRPVDIRPTGLGAAGADWNRALRATAATPHGPVAVYVAHLPSLRLGATGFGSARRDESAALLGSVLAAEPADRVILLGDLNSTTDDRGLAPIRAARMNTPSSGGFAFSWPASFPLARIDQILARSGTVSHIRTLPATRSDHLPVSAVIRFG